MCALLCVYVGVCLDDVSWHVHVHAHMRAGRVAVSAMSLMMLITAVMSIHILLLINTYNLRPVKSLFSTDRYAYAKCSLFRLWEPQPPDSSAELWGGKFGKGGAAERRGIAALWFPRPRCSFSSAVWRPKFRLAASRLRPLYEKSFDASKV